MPAKTLPGREVTCREGHTSTTRAEPGNTVRCNARRPDGGRCGVPVYVRKTAAGAAADAAGPWADVPAWTGERWPLDPAAEPCPECGGDASATPRGTLIYCAACPHVTPPAWVRDRATRAAERAESAAVAVRADPAGELRAHLALAEARARSADVYRQWAALLDPGELDGADVAPDVLTACQRLAPRFAALARKADSAPDPEALAVVRQVAAEHIQAARPVEHAVWEARERLAADDDDDYDDDGQGDDDGGAPAALPGGRVIPGQVVAERYEPRALPPPGPVIPAVTAWTPPGPFTPRAITGPPRMPVSAADIMARRAAARQRAEQAAAERLEHYGRCQFRPGHKMSAVVLGNPTPPATRQVTGNNTGIPGQEPPGATIAYICGAQKCLDLAAEWFKGQGYADSTYRDLP